MTDDNVIQFSQRDEEDLAKLLSEEAPSYHTVLQVWRAVLEPAASIKDEKVTPQWASRICSAYQGITVQQMNTFRDSYYSFLNRLREILEAEIATDDECFKHTTPAEDAAENAEHYRNLLFEWQAEFLRREIAWDCTADDAHIQIAVMSEVHKAMFGPTGITAFLDNIQFQYTEADQAELAAKLEAVKEGA